MPSLLARLTGRARPRGSRLLRDGIRALDRIGAALEQQNRLLEAAHPEAAARLKVPPVVESDVSYVNPDEVLAAERLRAEIHRQTGQWLSDEALLERLAAERA